MADKLERIDLATARSTLSTIVGRAAAGETFIITRYGKDVATISGNFTVSGLTTQMEHGAAAPTHRPAAEPLEVKGGSAWADRHPEQAAKDAILGRSRGRPKR